MGTDSQTKLNKLGWTWEEATAQTNSIRISKGRGWDPGSSILLSLSHVIPVLGQGWEPMP